MITSPRWGIELLRDGVQLSQHCNRFVDGAYRQWIDSGHMQDWIIVDCRHTMPKKYSELTPTLSWLHNILV